LHHARQGSSSAPSGRDVFFDGFLGLKPQAEFRSPFGTKILGRLTPPALPTIDLVNSFQLLATLANLDRHFGPLGDETDFLLAAFLGLTQEHSEIIAEANKLAQLKQKLTASNMATTMSGIAIKHTFISLFRSTQETHPVVLSFAYRVPDSACAG
jgi:hypothetical protein